jgi:hypothetical protein
MNTHGTAIAHATSASKAKSSKKRRGVKLYEKKQKNHFYARIVKINGPYLHLKIEDFASEVTCNIPGKQKRGYRYNKDDYILVERDNVGEYNIIGKLSESESYLARSAVDKGAVGQDVFITQNEIESESDNDDDDIDDAKNIDKDDKDDKDNKHIIGLKKKQVTIVTGVKETRDKEKAKELLLKNRKGNKSFGDQQSNPDGFIKKGDIKDDSDSGSDIDIDKI